MKERYSKVCSDILKYYSQHLSDKEIIAINKILKLDNYDNLNIIIFINKIIDRIWTNTLKTPNNYQEGKQFSFLVTREVLPELYAFDDFIDTCNISRVRNLKKYNKIHRLELITNENIDKQIPGIYGLIVEIDYTNSLSEPLLPIYFKQQKEIKAKTKLIVKGIYNISLGLKNFDSAEENTNEFANLAYLEKTDINKPLYNYLKNKKILDKNDETHLLDEIITYYLFNHNIKDKIKARDKLKTLYKTRIINKYKEYFNQKITLEDFVNYVFELLDNEPVLTNLTK